MYLLFVTKNQQNEFVLVSHALKCLNQAMYVPEIALCSSGPFSCNVLRPACNVTALLSEPSAASVIALLSFFFLNLRK